jgi:hypothetical protein
MTCGPLCRVYIGSNEYSSTRRTPKLILALVTSISKRVLVATSTRFPQVILASIEYTLYSFYTLSTTTLLCYSSVINGPNLSYMQHISCIWDLCTYIYRCIILMSIIENTREYKEYLRVSSIRILVSTREVHTRWVRVWVRARSRVLVLTRVYSFYSLELAYDYAILQPKSVTQSDVYSTFIY